MRIIVVPLAVVSALGGMETAHVLTQPNGMAIPTPLTCSQGRPAGLAVVFAWQCDTQSCNKR
jgi:hypothetical protein